MITHNRMSARPVCSFLVLLLLAIGFGSTLGCATAKPVESKHARLQRLCWKQNDASSCYELGWGFRMGEAWVGEKKDPAKAFDLFLRGCKLGDPRSCDGKNPKLQLGVTLKQAEPALQECWERSAAEMKTPGAGTRDSRAVLRVLETLE